MKKKYTIPSELRIYLNKDLWAFVRKIKDRLCLRNNSQAVNALIRRAQDMENEREKLKPRIL